MAAALGLTPVAPASAQTFQHVFTPPVAANVHAAWADYDNDGWVDLYVGDRMYRNNNGASFIDVGNPVWGVGIFGDFNNDGWLDYYNHWVNAPTVHLNNQNGTFTATSVSGLFGTQNSQGAALGDYNGDGYVDIYSGGYETFPTAYYADKIATNNQNGTFSLTWTQGNDAVTTPGRPRPARGVTAADFDRDGDLDIYVSNYRLEPNALWRNDGNGNFTDVAASYNAQAGSGHSIGAVWGDFNNDGRLDLFAGNFAHPGQPESRFLRNRGLSAGYTFQDMGTGGIPYVEAYASPVAGDIDNDGDLDLYFTTAPGYGDAPRLYRNDGNWTFTDVTAAWGLSGLPGTYQAAFADYDHDGYLDLVTDGKVYHNTGGSNHWLQIHLDGGGVFGASPLGTQVLVDTGSLKVLRQVESGTGEGNQNDLTLHFGLGGHTGTVDMTITWLGDRTELLYDIAIDQLLTIEYMVLGDMNRDEIISGLDIQSFINAFTNESQYKSAMGLNDFNFVRLADINGDGIFSGLDIDPFVDLLTGAGASSSQIEAFLSSVPEPGVASLMGILLAGLALRRVRTR